MQALLARTPQWHGAEQSLRNQHPEIPRGTTQPGVAMLCGFEPCRIRRPTPLYHSHGGDLHLLLTASQGSGPAPLPAASIARRLPRAGAGATLRWGKHSCNLGPSGQDTSVITSVPAGSLWDDGMASIRGHFGDKHHFWRCLPHSQPRQLFLPAPVHTRRRYSHASSQQVPTRSPVAAGCRKPASALPCCHRAQTPTTSNHEEEAPGQLLPPSSTVHSRTPLSALLQVQAKCNLPSRAALHESG